MKRAVILIVSCFLCLAGLAVADVNSPYGINSHVPDNRLLDLIAQAGIGWIRVDMNWFTLEPNKNQYNFGYMDSVVNNARARGLEIFATLAYTPGWANGTGNTADPPTDPNDWYNFVYNTVHHYRGQIKYWGMWNEPNLTGFFTGVAWQYREWILKPGAQAAKAADPSCFVLGPELSHLSSGDWPGWLEEIMKAGGSDYIDIITHHCYKGNTGDDTFNYLDKGAFHWPWDDPPLMDVLDSIGVGDKPVWLTEVGWATDDISESDQALYYQQLLWGMLQRDYLKKVFPYTIIDCPDQQLEPPFGILKSDYTPKQAYSKYRDFIANPTEPPSSGCNMAAGADAKSNAGMLALLSVPLFIWGMRRRK